MGCIGKKMDEATRKWVRAGRLLLAGKTPAQAAAAVGVARQTVYTWKARLLAARAAVDTGGGPLGLPVLQVLALFGDRVKAPALECGALGVCPIAFSTVPLRLGSRTRAGSATTPQWASVAADHVQFGLVQVGLEDPFLEVVQHRISGGFAGLANPCWPSPCVVEL